MTGTPQQNSDARPQFARTAERAIFGKLNGQVELKAVDRLQLAKA